VKRHGGLDFISVNLCYIVTQPSFHYCNSPPKTIASPVESSIRVMVTGLLKIKRTNSSSCWLLSVGELKEELLIRSISICLIDRFDFYYWSNDWLLNVAIGMKAKPSDW